MEIVTTGTAGTLESGDILVEVENRASGGVEIDLESPVGSQFGKQLRAVIEQAVHDCGVENIYIRAVDKGALDCTVRARVTAAVHRGAQNTDFRFA